MTNDYDAPRKTELDDDTDSLEELRARRAESALNVRDDVDDLVEGLELPGADLADEVLTVPVVPKREDEFTCTRCFLVRHNSQLAHDHTNVCTDCA